MSCGIVAYVMFLFLINSSVAQVMLSDARPRSAILKKFRPCRSTCSRIKIQVDCWGTRSNLFEIPLIRGHISYYRPFMAKQPRTPHERQPAPSPCRCNKSRSLGLLVAGDVRRQLVCDGKASIAGLLVSKGYSLRAELIILESGESS
jgi:hypothetical protein